ncbi:MAG: tetratricopeptide repeat protein [Gammaproteobacteria bacterium]|nr:tetratricopeptide repeat protein [Gammaproteobacteria bacterium]
MYSPDIVLRKMLFVFLVLLASSTLAADHDNDSMIESDSSSSREINRALNDFDHAWKMQDFPAAVTVAERIVVLLENSQHKQSINHAMALQNLANAQQAMGWHRKSEKNYRKSIQLIEGRQGSYGSELPTVLNNLGALYYSSLNYDLATDAFRRAQHITHRADGVYTLKQLEFVDWITLINIKTTRSKDADKQQRFYYSINVRNYGEDDPRMLPAMHKMADWFRRTGQLSSALKTYEKALFVIEKHELNELEKLQPLRGISSVTYLKGSCCSEDQLGEALQIVTRDPNSDHADELDALVHLADMHMIRKRRGKAGQYYRQAWSRLGAENPLTHELFSTPELLGVSRIEDVYNAYYQTVEGRSQMNKTVYRMPRQNEGSLTFGVQPKARSMSVIGAPLSLCHSRALELAHTDDTDDLERYFVDVDFTVTREGGVLNVSLVDSNAPNRLQRYVTNTLRYSRYRPTLRDGEAVDTDNIKLRQTFSRGDAVLPHQTSFNRISADGKRAVSLGCQILAMRS